MAQAVNMFRSDAGGLFETEHLALQDDLRAFIFGEIKNEASAKQLAVAMVAHMDATPPPVDGPDGWQGIKALINRLADTRPTMPVADVKPPITDQRPDNCRQKIMEGGGHYPRTCSICGIGKCEHEDKAPG